MVPKDHQCINQYRYCWWLDAQNHSYLKQCSVKWVVYSISFTFRQWVYCPQFSIIHMVQDKGSCIAFWLSTETLIKIVISTQLNFEFALVNLKPEEHNLKILKLMAALFVYWLIMAWWCQIWCRWCDLKTLFLWSESLYLERPSYIKTAPCCIDHWLCHQGLISLRFHELIT